MRRALPFPLPLAAALAAAVRIASAGDVAVDILDTIALGADSLGTETAAALAAECDAAVAGGLAVVGDAVFSNGIARVAPGGGLDAANPDIAWSDREPAWWADYGVLNGEPPNDEAAATAGQLKWIATCARAMLDDAAWSAGGAGDTVSNLVETLPPSSNSIAVTAAELKRIARPFAQRCVELQIDCAFSNATAVSAALAPAPRDGEIVTVGQIKCLFGFDPSIDADANAIPDWWERLHGVFDPDPPGGAPDPDRDSDGDGLSDAAEFALGTDPVSPDTDCDGVPDGLTLSEWRSHPLWAENGDCTNLVIFLYEPVVNGVAALRFDDLCIPLVSNAGPWCLCLPTNAVVDCRLVAEPGVVVMLWYGPPEAAVPTRSLVPGWSVPSSVAVPIWCDDPMAVFGGNNWGGGSCLFARPTLRVHSNEPGNPEDSPDICVHGQELRAHFTWSVEPAVCTGLWAYATGDLEPGCDDDFLIDVTGSALGATQGMRAGSLCVESAESPFFGRNVLFGSLSQPVSAHPCLGWFDIGFDFCLSCGVAHGGPWSATSCFHESWCASKTNLLAGCDCARPFVRIGSATSFKLVGNLVSCCHLHSHFSTTAQLLSAPGGLQATITNGPFLHVEPSARSPTIGGFVANYRILDGDGGVYRDLSLPFTCADLGVDPCLSDAQVPYDWQSAGPDAYYLQDGTFYVARRAAPYPVRLWNESPSDARLVFSFDSPTNGPSLFDSSLVTRHSSLVATNAAPFAALNDDRTVYLDALCSNALATLSLTLSDSATTRTFLSESLSVQVVDTAVGEHGRVRSATDRLSWDFSDAPEPVWIGVERIDATGAWLETVSSVQSFTPSLSLDIPPGDYLLEAYFPRVYDGVSSAAWSTNTLHIRPSPEFVRDVVGVQCGTDRRVEIALTNDTFHSDIQWTLSPIVANGPRFFATSNSVAAATSMSGVSNVWVSAGTVPGVYQVTASYPGFTNAAATVFSIQAELEQMWETRNPVNAVFNSTPKDDTSDAGYQETDSTNETTYGIHREKLYVASDSDDMYHISFRFSIVPVEATDLIVISGMTGDRLCTEKFRLNAPAISISFPSFSSGRALDLCKFRGTIEDIDGNPFSNEEDAIVFSVYEHPTSGALMEPGLVGINQARLAWHNGKINSLIDHIADPVPATSLMPHARALLTIFYDGNTNRVAPFLCPSSERTVSIDAFGNTFEGSDCYSEWLTHNSGADFNSQGFASIKEYSWSTNSEMSRFLALHKPFVLKKRHVNALDGYYETQTDTGTALKTFYIDYVAPAARLHLINSNNLSTVTLPIDGEGYSFPNANSTLFSSLSPAWVPGTTFRAGDGGSSKAGAWGGLIEEFFLNDDAFAEYEATGTVGRGRLFAPTYQFVVQRIDNPSAPDGFQCKTLAIRFSCRVEDLYDFNYEDSELASHAAALQIQRGNGTGGRHGIVFKDVFFIDHTYQNPFEMESGASIHSTGEEME